MVKGFELFQATIGSLILLSELVFGIFLAVICFQEFPTIMTIIGGLLVISSSAIVIIKNKC